MRARLELYLRATYGVAIELTTLPPSIGPSTDGTDAITQYRVLAVQHAGREVRGGSARATGLDPLERDLFEIAEARAVDACIAGAQPGLVPALERARAAALRIRVPPKGVSLEADVEELMQEALRKIHMDVAAAEESVSWARATALALRTKHGHPKRYRGIAPVMFWGTPVSVAGVRSAFKLPPRLEPQLRKASKKAARDASQMSAETHVAGGAASPPSDDAPPTRDAFAPAEHQGKAKRRAKAPEGVKHHYPEWDDNANAWHPDGAVVYVSDAPAESPAWAEAAEREHAVLLRQVRQRFERLQSHRLHLRRQPSGDELDLDACVNAVADRRAGRTPDDRLYAAVRPGRRPIAISLLVDASASTRAIAHDTLRIIDVERLAVLVAAQAFDALGDSYSMLAFSSDGAADVRVRTLKHADEPGRAALRTRVSGLAPRGETRMGAALRHATAHLLRRTAPHRLLLMISDGKPNDTDRYFIGYGVADSRRAVLEARAAGVHPYCITVDAEEPGEYLADIFGKTGYLVVRRPEQLPQALVRSVQMLIPG